MDLDAQVRTLVSAFEKKGGQLNSLLAVAMDEASILVESKAATLAPVDTGLLRKSISHRVIDRKGYPVGQIGTSVEYSAFQEFGTSKMQAQPFLMPALNSSKASIKEIIARRLKQAI